MYIMCKIKFDIIELIWTVPKAILILLSWSRSGDLGRIPFRSAVCESVKDVRYSKRQKMSNFTFDACSIWNIFFS